MGNSTIIGVLWGYRNLMGIFLDKSWVMVGYYGKMIFLRWSKESRKPCSQCTWIFWGCAQLSDVQIGSWSGSSSVSYWKGWHRHRFFCTCSASQTERRWKISVISMWSQCHSFLPELVGKSTGNHRRPLCVGGKIEKPWFPANFPQKTSHWMWTASISHQSLIDCILRLKVASYQSPDLSWGLAKIIPTKLVEVLLLEILQIKGLRNRSRSSNPHKHNWRTNITRRTRSLIHFVPQISTVFYNIT